MIKFFLCCIFLFLLSSCSFQVSASTDASAREGKQSTSSEIASYMSFLQSYSAKLGYSLQAKNKPLSSYYLGKLEDTVGEMERNTGEFDGYEIGKLIPSHLKGPIGSIRDSLEQGVFDEGMDDSYRALINRCNACHQFTNRGFIEISPAHGSAPINQVF